MGEGKREILRRHPRVETRDRRSRVIYLRLRAHANVRGTLGGSGEGGGRRREEEGDHRFTYGEPRALTT